MNTLSNIDVLQIDAKRIRGVVGVNMAGLTHEESVMRPMPAGNSANWVLGHLLSIYSVALPVLGEPPVTDSESILRYARGSTPLAAEDAMPLEDVTTLWNSACDAIEAGLAKLDPARLDEHCPVSPTGNPNETVHTFLLTVMFHQSYHSGQLGLLRRIVGHKGAIA